MMRPWKAPRRPEVFDWGPQREVSEALDLLFFMALVVALIGLLWCAI